MWYRFLEWLLPPGQASHSHHSASGPGGIASAWGYPAWGHACRYCGEPTDACCSGVNLLAPLDGWWPCPASLCLCCGVTERVLMHEGEGEPWQEALALHCPTCALDPWLGWVPL
jgi:hypothetical protein